jgi:DNA-3-methyladenine glycosylase II
VLLETSRPFDFALTSEVLSRLPRHCAWERSHGADEPGGPYHQRVLRTAAGPRVVTARPAPDGNGVLLDDDSEEAVTWARLSFGLEQDMAPFMAAAERDPYLRDAARSLAGLRVPLVDPWEAWVAAIVSQQVTLAFAFQSINSLCRLLAGSIHTSHPDGEPESLPLFVTPEQVLDSDPEFLKEHCKLSRNKTDYLKVAARATLDGSLDGIHDLPTEEAVARLTQLRGVGNWTARYWLLTTGRLDSLPYGDAGLRTAYKTLAGTHDGLEEWGESLGPTRGWAYFYAIWFAKRTPKR